MSKRTSELKKFTALLVRDMKDLTRFPYFEFVLILLTFQLLVQRSTSQVIFYGKASDLKFEVSNYMSFLYISSIKNQVESLYLIIVFLSSVMSYLVVSYFRDIGFLKIEFSLPIKRGSIYFSKFLASFLTLLASVISSTCFSIFIKNFSTLQAISIDQLLSGLAIVLIESFTVVAFVSSIATLLAFLIKWPVVPLVISIVSLYSLNVVSYNLQGGTFLLPRSLEEFEKRAISYMPGGYIKVLLNFYSLEPLLVSLFVSFLIFIFNYCYVSRRLEVA
ncbi:MAG: hypothetical protein ACP5HX_10620 [Thermoproteota archaeon]